MIYPCEALDKKYSKQSSSSSSRGAFEKEGESGTYALKQKRGRAMEKRGSRNSGFVRQKAGTHEPLAACPVAPKFPRAT